ncbi:Hypothetical Protein RSKD131_4301 [Cereibacter sphaeroides KD131]|nr:Hypothetical Protein RSKD131_4301 [Cereibacter sphaeroides KD131]
MGAERCGQGRQGGLRLAQGSSPAGGEAYGNRGLRAGGCLGLPRQVISVAIEVKEIFQYGNREIGNACKLGIPREWSKR